MLADEQVKIAETSRACTGEATFSLARGRDHWGCNCETYAGKVWRVEDPNRPTIPVHPNGHCEWRVKRKSLNDLRAELGLSQKETEQYKQSRSAVGTDRRVS